MTRSARTTIVLTGEDVRIPGQLGSLGSFRRWVKSPVFPERGRIDWIAGEVEIDMSPEEINTHGTPKAAIAGDLHAWIDGADRGVVLVDSTRITCPEADLSVEPDIVVVLFESLESGRVHLVRSPGSERCVEIRGAPDLVVECVSDSSVAKDRIRLRERYAVAGIPEYWIVDARPVAPVVIVLNTSRRRYREVSPGPDGFTRSRCLGAAVRLERRPPRCGLVRYQLLIRDR